MFPGHNTLSAIDAITSITTEITGHKTINYYDAFNHCLRILKTINGETIKINKRISTYKQQDHIK